MSGSDFRCWFFVFSIVSFSFFTPSTAGVALLLFAIGHRVNEVDVSSNISTNRVESTRIPINKTEMGGGWGSMIVRPDSLDEQSVIQWVASRAMQVTPKARQQHHSAVSLTLLQRGCPTGDGSMVNGIDQGRCRAWRHDMKPIG